MQHVIGFFQRAAIGAAPAAGDAPAIAAPTLPVAAPGAGSAPAAAAEPLVCAPAVPVVRAAQQDPRKFCEGVGVRFARDKFELAAVVPRIPRWRQQPAARSHAWAAALGGAAGRSYHVLRVHTGLPKAPEAAAGAAAAAATARSAAGISAATVSPLFVGVVPVETPLAALAQQADAREAGAGLVSVFGVGLGPAHARDKVPAAWAVTRWGSRSFAVNVGVLIDTRARQALIVDHMHPTVGAILIDIPPACKLVVCGAIKEGTQFMAVACKGYDQPAGLRLS